MTDITQESLQKKQEAIDLLAKRYRGMEQRTEDIDLRLRLYFEDLLEHSSAKEDDAGDWHGYFFTTTNLTRSALPLLPRRQPTKRISRIIKRTMTEQEFSRQVWRMYDQITTADGVKGKVLGVAFNTKSVRAYISGAPEWVKCDLIETHTTGKGADGDDTAIIEELHNKVLSQAERIGKLEEERRLLQEKISRNYLGELLRAVNVMQQGLQERKRKHEQIESSLSAIAAVIDKINNGGE